MDDLPRIDRINNGFSFVLNNKPFVMLAAETHNSAASSYEYMQYVWSRAKELNCNTLLVPIYWELVEPKENHFDYSTIEKLIVEARKQKKRLVLLWFGSWKNGCATYVPGWVKIDRRRFPRVENENGKTVTILGMDIGTYTDTLENKPTVIIGESDISKTAYNKAGQILTGADTIYADYWIYEYFAGAGFTNYIYSTDEIENLIVNGSGLLSSFTVNSSQDLTIGNISADSLILQLKGEDIQVNGLVQAGVIIVDGKNITVADTATVKALRGDVTMKAEENDATF